MYAKGGKTSGGLIAFKTASPRKLSVSVTPVLFACTVIKTVAARGLKIWRGEIRENEAKGVRGSSILYHTNFEH